MFMEEKTLSTCFIYGKIYLEWLQVTYVQMGKSSSKKQSIEIISKQHVVEQLNYSCTFSWCMYRKRNLIRHVGIIIKFDGKPFCTVDFGVVNLNPSCLVACASEVTIKRVLPGFEASVDCGDDVQCIYIRNEYCRQYAAWIIQHLLTPNQKQYSLLRYNCRDNTKDAVNRVCNTGQCNGANLEATRQMILRTQNEDPSVVFTIVAILASVLGIIFSKRKNNCEV